MMMSKLVVKRRNWTRSLLMVTDLMMMTPMLNLMVIPMADLMVIAMVKMINLTSLHWLVKGLWLLLLK